jgi:hypothetical protein
MSRDAAETDKAAATTDAGTAAGALGSYNSDIGSFMGNVNSQLAAGNPYESESYLTNQNLQTSGAMNSENDAAKEALGKDVQSTGENGASVANTLADSKRAGQRDLTNYNATRDTANEDKWLQDEQGLTRDQLAGADSEAGMYGHATGAQGTALGDFTTASDAEDQMWAGLGEAAMGGAGTGLGAAFG